MCAVLRQYQVHDSCPECDGDIIASEERGERVCPLCGLIVDEKEIDASHPDKRAFSYSDKQDKLTNCSPISPLAPDIGLCTVIDKHAIHNPDLKRAAKIDSQLSWKNRNFLIAITELKRISYNMNIPKHIKKTALGYYKEAFEKNILKGRSIHGMIAACLYYSCKLENFPRTFQEFISETTSRPKAIRKCYNVLIHALNLRAPSLGPQGLIPKYIADLKLGIEVENLAIKILTNYLSKATVQGVNPKGLCAGAIYLISKLKNIRVSQKDISTVVGVTEVTLRARYKELLDNLELMIL